MQDIQNDEFRVSQIEDALTALRSQIRELLPEDFDFCFLADAREFKVTCYCEGAIGYGGSFDLAHETFTGLLAQLRTVHWMAQRAIVTEGVFRS